MITYSKILKKATLILAIKKKSILCYSTDTAMPMIPLGLKETKEIDFRDPFKDFILEHYSEEANQYEEAIVDFMDTRQVNCFSSSSKSTVN